jgi:hypothetical protein
MVHEHRICWQSHSRHTTRRFDPRMRLSLGCTEDLLDLNLYIDHVGKEPRDSCK